MAYNYESEMLKVTKLTREYVGELLEIWKRIFNENACLENMEKLQSHVRSFYNDLVEESMEKEEFVKAEIDELKKEADTLKRLLHVDFEVAEIGGGPLLAMQEHMDNSLWELRERVRLRQEEIFTLRKEGDELCDELGEPVRLLESDPLPTAEELSEYRKYLDLLKEKRTLRINKLTLFRRNIKGFVQMLELHNLSECEERLINERQPKLNEDTFNDLIKMYEHYRYLVEEMRGKIDETKKKLEITWDRLNISPNSRNKFKKYTEYTRTTYDILKVELQRCDALKRQNIKNVVHQVRKDLLAWWDLTLKSEGERAQFGNFNTNCYTEDLLVLHEMELDDLKTFYETNREIFELFGERKVLWDRMGALEAKSTDPKRYNNRGGQLLQEEKERKTIARKLPQIEEQLQNLVKAYEEKEMKPFLVYGENIVDVITSEWAKKREEKEKMSSARKNITALTPISTRNISCASIKRTPSSLLKSTGSNKRFLQSCERLGPPTKRTLLYTLNSPKCSTKPTSTKPSCTTMVNSQYKVPMLRKNRVIATTIRRTSKRRSAAGARKRRSTNKGGNAKPIIKVTECTSTDKEQCEMDETYGYFRNCLKTSSRSSVVTKLEAAETERQQNRKGQGPSTQCGHMPTISSNTSSRSLRQRSPRKLATKELAIIF